MFERVVSMAAYVKSQSFVSPVVFLDIDAFLIRPVSELFSSDFDVGLTHRHIVGQMPINGMFLPIQLTNPRWLDFFESYLASYLAAEKSETVGKNLPKY